MTIAVDAMGSAWPRLRRLKALYREPADRILLVGDKATVEKQLARHDGLAGLPLEVIHAPERITMDDHAAKAARGKRDSSMHICARLVAAGTADGYLSAGNTGACMAIAKMVLGKVPGVDRPALFRGFSLLPKRNAGGSVVDVGANVDCLPEMLAQFARDGGDLFPLSSALINRPRVGILSIGEEEHKGNNLTPGHYSVAEDNGK